jgi:hypothetical protein
MTAPAFDSLISLLIHVFRQLGTPLLTIERITDFLSKSDFSVTVDGDVVQSNSIPHRLLLNTISNSDQFVRSGSRGAQIWALRPQNPFAMFHCDASIAASIEQLLTKNGPMSLDQFLSCSDFPAGSHDVVARVLEVHAEEFRPLPDGRIWFINSPLPVRATFERIQQAIEFGFSIFPAGATIEELRRLLCLATVSDLPITRLMVQRELAAKPELFVQIERGKYALVGSEGARQLPPVVVRTRASSVGPQRAPQIFEPDDDDRPFNPESFFGGKFSFALE